MRIISIAMRTVDRNIAAGDIGDFLNDLPTPAAGRDGIAGPDRSGRSTSDGDGGDPGKLSVAIGLGDGDGFGAQGHAVAGILEIRSRHDIPVIQTHGTADMEIGIGRIGILSRLARCRDELFNILRQLRTTTQPTEPSIPSISRPVFAVHMIHGRAVYSGRK